MTNVDHHIINTIVKDTVISIIQAHNSIMSYNYCFKILDVFVPHKTFYNSLSVNHIMKIVDKIETIYSRSLNTIWVVEIETLCAQDLYDAVASQDVLTSDSLHQLEGWYESLMPNSLTKHNEYLGETKVYKKMKGRLINNLNKL